MHEQQGAEPERGQDAPEQKHTAEAEALIEVAAADTTAERPDELAGGVDAERRAFT